MRQDGAEWKQRFFPNTSLGLPSLICVDMGMISYAMGLYGLASLLVYCMLTRPGANCPLPLQYWSGSKTASLSPQRFRNWVKCKFWFQPTLHFLFPCLWHDVSIDDGDDNDDDWYGSGDPYKGCLTQTRAAILHTTWFAIKELWWCLQVLMMAPTTMMIDMVLFIHTRVAGAALLHTTRFAIKE